MTTVPYKNFIIIGSNGFSGKFLVHQLRSLYGSSVQLTGVGRKEYSETEKIDKYFQRNIINESTLQDLFNCVDSDRVCCFHLSGILHGSDKRSFIDSHATGTLNLLQAFLQLRPKSRFVNIGSSAEYGYQGRRAITESNAPKPAGWYGLTKYMQTIISSYYFQQEGLDTVMVRTFNAIGPGQSNSLVVGRIVSQAAECKLGQRDRITLGNTETYRDFIDIRDAVNAYHAVSLYGRPGEIYNVGSGQAIQINQILEMIKEIAELDIEITGKTVKHSGFDIPYQCADITKINRETNWQPSIPLKQTLIDMFEYEIRKIQHTK